MPPNSIVNSFVLLRHPPERAVFTRKPFGETDLKNAAKDWHGGPPIITCLVHLEVIRARANTVIRRECAPLSSGRGAGGVQTGARFRATRPSTLSEPPRGILRPLGSLTRHPASRTRYKSSTHSTAAPIASATSGTTKLPHSACAPGSPRTIVSLRAALASPGQILISLGATTMERPPAVKAFFRVSVTSSVAGASSNFTGGRFEARAEFTRENFQALEATWLYRAGGIPAV